MRVDGKYRIRLRIENSDQLKKKIVISPIPILEIGSDIQKILYQLLNTVTRVSTLIFL